MAEPDQKSFEQFKKARIKLFKMRLNLKDLTEISGSDANNPHILKAWYAKNEQRTSENLKQIAAILDALSHVEALADKVTGIDMKLHKGGLRTYRLVHEEHKRAYESQQRYLQNQKRKAQQEGRI